MSKDRVCPAASECHQAGHPAAGGVSVKDAHEYIEHQNFVLLLRNAIRHAGETAQIDFDDKKFSFVGEWGEKVFNLDTIYREYCTVPLAERGQALRNYARCWFSDRKKSQPCSRMPFSIFSPSCKLGLTSNSGDSTSDSRAGSQAGHPWNGHFE
jgi:hypothetical protein